jgi:hypothetical protein
MTQPAAMRWRQGPEQPRLSSAWPSPRPSRKPPRADTNYTLGSVLNHVLLHQTVIGLEAKKQLEKVGDLSRHGVRALRRRLQLRRHRLPLPRRQGRRQEGAPGGGRADLLPDA